MRGADPVNDELEIGFDQPFEKRWHVVELVARGVMIVYVLAAGAGLLGSGPFSHHQITDSTHSFEVDYEPITRDGNSTQITIHILRPPPGAAQLAITLNNQFGEPFGLSDVLPRPARIIAGPDGMTDLFDILPGEGGDLVRFKGSPTQAGVMRLSAQLGTGPKLSWTQVVVP
jgi:hypothetical protein